MEAKYQYDAKKELEDKRKRQEDALRRRIRKELEAKYASRYKRSWLNKPYGKAVAGGAMLALCGALFAGGFYFGQSEPNKNKHSMVAEETANGDQANVLITQANGVDQMELIERVTANGAPTKNENSLVFVSDQMSEQVQNAPMLPESYVQNQGKVDQDEIMYRLPENSRKELIPEYVDFLLSIEQISRAQEIVKHLAERKNIDQVMLTRMNAHILAQLLARSGSVYDQKQLQEHIDRLSAEDKIATLLYVIKAVAIRGELSENFLNDASKQLDAIKDPALQKLWREKITLARAEMLSTRAMRYAQKGLWAEVKQTARALHKLSNIQLNDNTAAAIHIIAYSAYVLAQDKDILQTAQQKIMALNPTQLVEADSNNLLVAWEAHAFELSTELNRYLLDQVFLPKGSTKLASDARSLSIWRVCNSLNFKKDLEHLTQRLDPQQSEVVHKKFRTQVYVYSKIDETLNLFRANNLVAMESNIRKLAVELLDVSVK